MGEYEGKLEAGQLEPIVLEDPSSPKILADGRLLWRVFDNLLSNICKYAMPGTRVYLSSAVENGKVVICFKNISRSALNISADELMERFVRGDSSPEYGGQRSRPVHRAKPDLASAGHVRAERGRRSVQGVRHL